MEGNGTQKGGGEAPWTFEFIEIDTSVTLSNASQVKKVSMRTKV